MLKQQSLEFTETNPTFLDTTTKNGSSTSLLAVIAVLVVLQVATMMALISTCVVFKRKLKQNNALVS